MGQKVSPIGLRVGVIREWESKWFANKDFADLLLEDVKIRKFLFAQLKSAAVARIEIERVKNRVDVIVFTARPGVVLGVNGETVEKLSKEVTKLSGGKTVQIRIVELQNPDLSAVLVARSIAEQLEQRASFRTSQKRAIQKTMRAGAKGIKTLVSGRLGGTDIARSEGYAEGVVPLHTLRADIDYAWVEAHTTYGRLGVKVWICRGEVLTGMVKDPEAPRNPVRDDRRGPRKPRPERGRQASSNEEGGN
jgi:small subunit ribosomal protein S3